MTAPGTFKQSDVRRAIAGALAADMKIAKVSIAPDGTITIIPESAADNDDDGPSPWDDE